MTYYLTIGGKPHLQQGVCQAAVSTGIIDLEFYQDNKLIKRVNLAADRTSISQTLLATRQKIDLICERLGISSDDLDYDRSDLSRPQKMWFKVLFLKKIFCEAFIPSQWVIVYKHKDDNKWRKLVPDSSLFQADPFIVYHENKYYVFYEELQFSDYHGYLKVAELDTENNRLINDAVILKLDYHLSFPNVFQENGQFFMIPESADNHTVDLFECTDFPYKWKKKQTLLDNIQAVDATPLKTDDGWYLFLSEIIPGAACDDELSIYKSDNLFEEPLIKLYDEPVVSDVTNARMAGHFIHQDGDLFRVSQNCGKRYGHQANINKVLQIEGGYKEERIKTLKPDFGALGFHTYNQVQDLVIGDMEIARFDGYSLKRFVWGNIKKHLLGLSASS